jgi:hypothetical protein
LAVVGAGTGGTILDSEEPFLRRLAIRLRGGLMFSVSPEVAAILREAIMLVEERLAAIDEERPPPGRRQP